MTDFVVTITDPAQLAGITWAREQYNASLPPPYVPPDTVVGGAGIPMPAPKVEGLQPAPQTQGTIDTDDAYVQWVMESAAASYAVQKDQAEWRAAYEDSLNPAAQRRAPNSDSRSDAPRRTRTS